MNADVLQSTSPGASGLTTLRKYVVFMSLMVIPSVSWGPVMVNITLKIGEEICE